MFRKSLILAAALLAGTSLGALAGTVTPLTNNTPSDGVVYGFLLTDGSLLFQGGLRRISTASSVTARAAT